MELHHSPRFLIIYYATVPKHECLVITNYLDSGATFPGFSNIPISTGRKISVRRTLVEVVKAAWVIGTERIPPGADILLISSEGIGDFYGLASRSRVPALAFCHTPLKVVYDSVRRQSFLREMPPLRRLTYRLAMAVFRVLARSAWKRYRLVVCNSAEVRSRVILGGLAPPAAVHVAHPGVDEARFRNRRHREPVFVVPGRLAVTKGLDLAIASMKAFIEAGGVGRMVIVGAVDAKSTPYADKLQRLASGLPIEFVINPTDETMARYLSSSAIGLFTAPNEDWGIVVLEMMAAGLPVLAVGRGGPTEIISAGETGYLLDEDPQQFAFRMRTLWDDPDLLAKMREAARTRALGYGWDEFAARLDALIDRTLAGCHVAEDAAAPPKRERVAVR